MSARAPSFVYFSNMEGMNGKVPILNSSLIIWAFFYFRKSDIVLKILLFGFIVVVSQDFKEFCSFRTFGFFTHLIYIYITNKLTSGIKFVLIDFLKLHSEEFASWRVEVVST